MSSVYRMIELPKQKTIYCPKNERRNLLEFSLLNNSVYNSQLMTFKLLLYKVLLDVEINRFYDHSNFIPEILYNILPCILLEIIKKITYFLHIFQDLQ